MRIFSHTEAGHEHVNEDVVRIETHLRDEDSWLCALADGQGGQRGGGEAARIAVDTTIEKAQNYAPQKLTKGKLWPQVIGTADDAVATDKSAGYTTLIALCVSDKKVCGASCGDSAVLLFNNGTISILTEHQRKNPPVGSSASQPIAFEAKLSPSWKLLIMSDGVWKFAGWDTIHDQCREFDGTELIVKLRTLAAGHNNKLPDDFTIALFEA